MKGVEAQLQKTFLVKIFKNQQDLLSLEQVSMAEENQKRRAKFRAKQLAELEKRKLDCRVGSSSMKRIPAEMTDICRAFQYH